MKYTEGQSSSLPLLSKETRKKRISRAGGPPDISPASRLQRRLGRYDAEVDVLGRGMSRGGHSGCVRSPACVQVGDHRGETSFSLFLRPSPLSTWRPTPAGGARCASTDQPSFTVETGLCSTLFTRRRGDAVEIGSSAVRSSFRGRSRRRLPASEAVDLRQIAELDAP